MLFPWFKIDLVQILKMPWTEYRNDIDAVEHAIWLSCIENWQRCYETSHNTFG